MFSGPILHSEDWVSAQFATLTMGHAGWPNSLRPGDGAFSRLRVSEMRHALRRRFWKAQLFLLGSVSLSRLRATDLSRKLARYRSLPAFRAREAVSHGLPGPHLALHPGRCQRVCRLAHLRRLRPSLDRNCPTDVRGGVSRLRSRRHRL